MKNKFVYCIVLIIALSLFYNCRVQNSLSSEMKYKLDFYTGYHQFYISGVNAPLKTISTFPWKDEAIANRVDVNKGTLGILTKSYGHIKGELEILKTERGIDDIELYDHIVELPISIKSGILRFIDCPNNSIEKEVKVPSGEYRARVYSLNLRLHEDEDEEEGNYFYKIEIWKSSNTEFNIIKKFKTQ